MTVDKKVIVQTGQTFQAEQVVISVHDGARGARGIPGEAGPQGENGESIVVRGPWAQGTEYCPLDAVRDRSTLVDHVWSMYVQRSDQPCAPSDTAPHLDTHRWQEIGPYEWGNYLGGIWEVEQLNHEFTKVGQPVAYSWQANRYILADCRRADELPIGVVREVVDANHLILQSSGEVPNIDKTVIWPDGSDWNPGRIYYVATVRGRVAEAPPLDSNYWSCPILMPTDVYAPGGGSPAGGRNGVVLPWKAAGGPGSQDYITVGWLKFYFTITTDGQVTVTGPDDRGVDLAYQANDNTEVFLNGVNLFLDDYTASDGVAIQFPEGLAAGDVVEVWTPDRPLDVLVPSTAVKIDNIETLFDGVTVDFPLTYGGGTAAAVQSTPNIMIWMDGNPQEPFVDYDVLPDPNARDGSILRFTAPPQAGDRFWGLLGVPVGDSRFILDRWQPDQIWEPESACIHPDPAFPQRGDNDPLGRRADIIWKNETGASIAPNPVFDPLDGWTPVSRARDDAIMYRVKEWDPAFQYRLDDQVYATAVLPSGDAPQNLYRCRVDAASVGTFVSDEWERITNLNLLEHDPDIGYPPGAEVVEPDPLRSTTFRTHYQNTRATSISRGPFNPDDWSAVGATYYRPYGPEMTQTGVLSGGQVTKTGPDEVTIAAGSGIVVNKTTDPDNPTSAYVAWADTVVDMTGLADLTTLGIDSTGGPVTTPGVPGAPWFRSNIALGTVTRDPLGGEILNPVAWPVTTQTLVDSILDIHRLFIKQQIVAGGGFGPGAAGGLEVGTAPSQIFALNANFHTNPQDPHIVNMGQVDPIQMQGILQTGTLVGPVTSTLPTDGWDSGGVLTPLAPGEAATGRMFYNIPQGIYYYLYGQRVYNSLTEAVNQRVNEDNTLVAPGALDTGSGSVFIGYVSHVDNAVDLTDETQADLASGTGLTFDGSAQVVTELDGLNDVVLVTRKGGQKLVYDPLTGVWRNTWDTDESTTWWARPLGTANSFQPVYHDGTGWTNAVATAAGTLATGFCINSRVDPDISPSSIGDIVSSGVVAWSQGTYPAGSLVYLSDDPAAGPFDMLLTPPARLDSYTQPVFYVLDPDHILVLGAAGEFNGTKAAQDRMGEYVVQAAHGFTQGVQVYQDAAGVWQLAQADTLDTLKSATVHQPALNSFEAVISGRVPWTHGLASQTHYLSATVPGGYTDTPPQSLTAFQQVAFTTAGPDAIRVVDQVVVRNAVTAERIP